jgi:hypothetical protein
MITVYRDIDEPDDLSPMFLDINAQEYKIYYSHNNDLEKYDISIDPPPPGNHASVKFKAYLQLDIWDNFENQGWAIAHNNQPDMYVITNAWDPNHINDKIIYNDFLFNRTEAYYQNYNFSPDTKPWYYRTKSAYSIPDQNVNLKTKLFVGPNKTWPLEIQHKIYKTNNYHERHIKYRPKIFQKLLELEYLGHIGNSHANEKYFLVPNFICPNIVTINQLLALPIDASLIQQANGTNRFGYSPPHNAYYENTFISIYGETIEYGTTIAPTEKTYDPLIKGHFILPFSCSGFIQFLKTKGFKFPQFIDYGYDTETDDDKRFDKYVAEVDRLLAMPLIDWQQHWIDNTDVRAHNQQIFETAPYDRVDLTQLINLAKNA